MSKRAVILAGGKGIRLRPYTVMLPKPLMPMGEFPILEVILRQLSLAGFSHITLAVNHQAEIIRNVIGDGKRWGIKVDYSLEQKALGTLGPLTLIEDLPEQFLFMNADLLTDLDFSAFYADHLHGGVDFSIAGFYRENPSSFGELQINECGEVRGFREKPINRMLVSMGVYMMSRGLLAQVPKEQPYGVDTFMVDLIRGQNHPRVFIHEGNWLDIGTPEDYHEAVLLFEKQRDHLLYGNHEAFSVKQPKP
ncbi:MAG: nucleotidyltransferase family protein [Bacteroidota bacterium]